MTVTFCGHHDAVFSESDLGRLTRIIIDLINNGANCFLLGGYGNFDLLSAKAVKKVKEKIQVLNLYLLSRT